MLELSIILPVHNESDVINRTIKEICNTLNKRNISYEIICVENGSTDDTFEKLLKLSRVNKNLKLYHSSLGWGNAVREGLRHVGGKYTAYMVSDGQVHAKILVKLIDELKSGDCDLVKVKRITRENFVRYFNSRIYNISANVIFDLDVYDINGTPKIASTKLLKNMNFTSPNISFDLELLLNIQDKKGKIMEIPVESFRRKSGKSTTNWKSVAEMYYYILKFISVRL